MSASAPKKPKKAKSATGTPGTAESAPKAPTKPSSRPIGLATHAHGLLLKSLVPLSVKELIAQVLASGRWSTTGKTPEATLYAVIVREIATRKTESRFVKTSRGRFAARPAK